MKTFTLIPFVVLLMQAALPSNAQFKQEIKAKIHEYLLVQQQLNSFNGLVQISNAAGTFTDTIGFANMEYSIPIQPASVFRIASITKQFTAAIMAKAIVDRKVRLDDSLRQFFPSAPTSWQGITIRQLLTHTSGIPHNEGIKAYWQTKSLLPFTPAQAISEIFSMALLFRPGKGTQYSSPGYMLLALILEQVYNASLQHILSKEIFIPLEMHTTGIYNPLRVIPLMTSGYHATADSLMAAPYRDYSLMKGSGDLYTTAADLRRWNNSFQQNSYWHPEVKKLLFTIQNNAPLHGHSDPYGYGWFLRQPTPPLPEARYTGGGTFGCSAISVQYPGNNTSLVILSNVSGLPINQLWSDIEKIMLEQPFQMPQIENNQLISTSELTALPGTYAAPTGPPLQIIKSENRLFAKLGNNPAFEIYKSAGLQYFARKMPLRFLFTSGNNGQITAVQTEGRGQTITFTRKS